MKRIGLTAILLCCLLGDDGLSKRRICADGFRDSEHSFYVFFVCTNPNADSYA